jgi:hypothetical protein
MSPFGTPHNSCVQLGNLLSHGQKGVNSSGGPRRSITSSRCIPTDTPIHRNHEKPSAYLVEKWSSGIPSIRLTTIKAETRSAFSRRTNPLFSISPTSPVERPNPDVADSNPARALLLANSRKDDTGAYPENLSILAWNQRRKLDSRDLRTHPAV